MEVLFIKDVNPPHFKAIHREKRNALIDGSLEK
jgi:hypothetical protein